MIRILFIQNAIVSKPNLIINQIPGAVLEDLTFRSRYYFNQDLMGAHIKYRWQKVTLKALYGAPLNAVLPPNQTIADRRPDRVGMVDVEYSLGQHTVGGSFQYLDHVAQQAPLSMVRASGSLSPSITYYTEIAKNLGPSYSLLDFNASTASYAWYANVNYAGENFGITTELKSYQDFILGLGMNQPPALVRQHVYRQLNRSTHVMNPASETGYQVEAYYSFSGSDPDEPAHSTLTLNHTLAINDFGHRFVFREYFIEWASTLLQNHDYKLFADYAEDPFKSESARLSAGTYIDWKLNAKSGLSTEFEWQRFERLGNLFQNQLVAMTYNYRSAFSGGFLLEYSTDNFLLAEGQTEKFWLGANLKYKPGYKNTFLLFVGTRRGGPACNAGVCYEILDFEGAELRWTLRL